MTSIGPLLSIPEKNTCLLALLFFSLVEKGLPLASSRNSQAPFPSLLFLFLLLFLLWGAQGSLKTKRWHCSSVQLSLSRIQHDSGEEGAKGRDRDSCTPTQNTCTHTDTYLYTDDYAPICARPCLHRGTERNLYTYYAHIIQMYIYIYRHVLYIPTCTQKYIHT